MLLSAQATAGLYSLLSPTRVVALAEDRHSGGEDRSEARDPDPDLPANLRFLLNLQLIRAQLLVGGELIGQGQKADGLWHFRAASNSIIPRLGPELKRSALSSALTELVRIVNRRQGKPYDKQLAAVQDALLAAEKLAEQKESNWPPLAVDTVLELLRMAAADYNDALANGRIVSRHKYEDSRGSVLQAERLFESVSPTLARMDASAVRAAHDAFEELKRTWPSPLAPSRPISDLSTVLAGMSKVELQIFRFR